MLSNLSIQRSLMGAVGLLMVAGMLVLAVILVFAQHNARQARSARLSAFFRELSLTSQASREQMNSAVGAIIDAELNSIRTGQASESDLRQKERARQLAQLIASFIAPYLDRNDDAQIDIVCRSAAYDSDIGVLLVEDEDGYYYGGYYREDHPGLIRRLSPGGESIPFGPDRVARALLEDHSASVHEERTPIYSPRDITKRIGWTRLITLNDRNVRDAESLDNRADVLQSRVMDSLAEEAERLSAEQSRLVERTIAAFELEGERSDQRLSRITIMVIFGVLVCSLTVIALLSAHLLKPLQKATAFAASLGEGDLSRRMEPGSQYDARRLALALNAMADALEARGKETQGALSELRDVFSRVNRIANDLGGSARDIAESSHSFTAGFAELGNALKDMTKTMAGMEGHSAKNAENAAHVTAMSEEVSVRTRKGREEMRAVTEAMGMVTNVYARLTGMARTIDSIAFQTNLLAINASVEAAHAGRYGKGFSVVADEVRTLSAHSSGAAEEARKEVAFADEQMDAAMNRAQTTAEAFAVIAESTQKVSQALDTVRNSSNEQLEGVRLANATMDRIAAIANDGIEEARRIASTTTILSEMAEQLNSMLDRSTYVKRTAATGAVALPPRARGGSGAADRL